MTFGLGGVRSSVKGKNQGPVPDPERENPPHPGGVPARGFSLGDRSLSARAMRHGVRSWVVHASRNLWANSRFGLRHRSVLR